MSNGDVNGEAKSAASGEIEVTSRPVPSDVLRRLKSTDWKERGRASVELSHSGTAGVPKLVEISLRDGSETVRGIASGTLSSLCDLSAVAPLMEVLGGDERLIVKEEAVGALVNMLHHCESAEKVQAFESRLDEAISRLGEKADGSASGAIGVLRRRVANKKEVLEMSGELLTGERPKPPKDGKNSPQRGRIRS